VASIEKRTRAGKVSYSVRYRSPDGRSRRKVFARKVDAESWLHANETAKQERRWIDPSAGRERFGEWAERWYATTAALRPTTRRDYRSCSTARCCRRSPPPGWPTWTPSRCGSGWPA
jgi:hypothetical protein